jgi:hypothetical protein
MATYAAVAAGATPNIITCVTKLLYYVNRLLFLFNNVTGSLSLYPICGYHPPIKTLQ